VAKEYLKNKDLLLEIIRSKEQSRLTPPAQKMLILLANKTIKKMRYYNPDDRDDCIQTGLVDMFANWHNFDPNKSTNAFAYFTEVFKRGIARGFNELYKKKGDPDNKHKVISIQSSNNGEGIFNL
jgi:DNA-directed RNA polymerase specialized sigma subunit